MLNEVIIVIPYYKNNINELEKVSLLQLMKVLKKYNKCLLVPQRVKCIDFALDETCEIMRCPDEWFDSTVSYSKMMLDYNFYKKFISYQYMLIHQLDAFVFDDKLVEFSRMGYDYIGAPWYRSSSMYRYSKSYVGNGGLSLRNIHNTIRVLENNLDVINEYLNCNVDKIGEDVVFSYFGSHPKYSYSVAPIGVAKKFSLECNFHKSYATLKDNLPFGCHHWWNSDYEVWKEYIRKQGYDIKENYPYIKKGLSIESRKNGIAKYLLERIILQGEVDIPKKIFLDFIYYKFPIMVWGGGIVGRRCLNLLEFLDIPIDCIIDSDDKKERYIKGIEVKKPSEIIFAKNKSMVIVATSRHYDEIATYLKNIGMVENEDFYNYQDIERHVAFKRYKIFWDKYK